MTAEQCPLCAGKDQYTMLFKIADNRSVLSCRCGLQSIYPFPSEAEIKDIYDDGYYDFSGIKGGFREIFDLKLKTCRRLISKADAFVSPSKRNRYHLDIGCAFGYMLEAAQQAGYKSQGLEISPAADEALALGYNVRKVTLEEAAFPEESFDLVSAVDVLEHIRNPKVWIAECKRVLKQGGMLLLVTPDCSSLPARVRKAGWPHYKTEHLYYYSPRTAERLLSGAGFEKISVSTGIRYLTLQYITAHYEKFQSGSLETKALKTVRRMLPRSIFRYPLPFPSEMVVTARRP